MIRSLGSKETEKVWDGIRSAKLPIEIQRIGRRKLRMINNSLDINDLRIPPANRLEKLRHCYEITCLFHCDIVPLENERYKLNIKSV